MVDDCSSDRHASVHRPSFDVDARTSHGRPNIEPHTVSDSDPAKFCETSVSECGYTRPRYCLLIVGTGGTTTLSLRRTYDEESAGSLGSGGIRLASRHCVGGADRQS